MLFLCDVHPHRDLLICKLRLANGIPRFSSPLFLSLSFSLSFFPLPCQWCSTNLPVTTWSLSDQSKKVDPLGLKSHDDIKIKERLPSFLPSSFTLLLNMIEPFDIPGFTAAELERLYDRLDNSTLPQELSLEDTAAWTYGSPRRAVEPLKDYWRHTFDWEPIRTKLNQWHHYKWTNDLGVKLHFIHEPSPLPNAIPLILLHGWPSTFYEFDKVIAPLREGEGGSQVRI